MAEIVLRRPLLNLLCKSKSKSTGYRRYSAPTDGSIPTAKLKYVPSEGTYPKGFQAGTAHVGVKASNTKFDDLTLIVSEKPCTASAVFTRNKFQAAPVVVSREILHARQQKGIKAVIINSGCANAVTGKKGLEDARLMATETDRLLLGDAKEGSEDPRTCVMSTGVIGQKLPIEKLTSKIPNAISSLGSTHDHWLKAARAICTTDTFPKLVSTQFTLPSYPGRTFAMTGMIKGAGMIAPNMGTLLGVIATDAPISPLEIKKFLGTACNKTFNAIVIDGDTSTNDTVMLMANGAAAVDSPEETPNVMLRCDGTEDALAFQTALDGLSTSLSQLVVRDGEGATKFVTIRIKGAPRKQHAYAIANSIAKSPLVKTALYGRDANWGRILCAIGYTRPLVIDGNETVLPDEVSVSFVPRTGPEVEHGELKLLEHGEPVEVDEARASRILAEEDLEILVRLRKFSLAEEEAVVWTCDFSHEYVTINGDYRT